MTHRKKAKRRLPLWAAVVALAFAGTALGVWIGQTSPSTEARARKATVPSVAPGIDPSQVCFINDRYMGKPQIPVSVEGKTYYGCCQGCADRLRADRSTRFATDPHTGKEVDKATAFIVTDPHGGEQVLYFDSADTYAAYQASVE